uniref:Uncharacterized protein n=1 Tax=Desulfobacca acetoxidans TaxID=60893 RepID=A0A7V4G845_9BACT
MEKIGLGQILAFVGLVVLLLTGVSRQQARRGPRRLSPGFVLWQRWGRLAGLALVLGGLLLMTINK